MRLSIALFLLLVSTVAQARVHHFNGGYASTSLIVVTTTGVTAGSAASIYYGDLDQELSDWKNPATASTSKLDRQCGVNFEFRLLGANLTNLLFVGIKNASDSAVQFKPGDVKLRFIGGRQRMASFSQEMDPIEVRPQWRVLAFVPFPEKGDFKGRDAIDVEIPIYDDRGQPSCTIKSRLNRPTEIAPDPATYTDHDGVEAVVELGKSVYASKNIANLGSKPSEFNFAFYLYPWLKHGFFLNAGTTGFGGGNAATFLSETGPMPSGSPKLYVDRLTLGYSHREFFSSKLVLAYDIGLSNFAYNYDKSDDSHVVQALGAFHHQLNLDYRFAKLGEGSWRGCIFGGVAFFQDWIPGGALGSIPANGHFGGFIARIKWGG